MADLYGSEDDQITNFARSLNRGVVGGVNSLIRLGKWATGQDTTDEDAIRRGIEEEHEEQTAGMSTSGRVIAGVGKGIGEMAASLPLDIATGGLTRVATGLSKLTLATRAAEKLPWLPAFAIGMGETAAMRSMADTSDTDLSTVARLAKAGYEGAKGITEGMLFHKLGSLGTGMSPGKQYIAQTLGIQPIGSMGITTAESLISGHGVPGAEELATAAGTGMVVGGGMGLAGARSRYKLTNELLSRERDMLGRGYNEVAIDAEGNPVADNQATNRIKIPYSIADTQANLDAVNDPYIKGRMAEVIDEYKDTRPPVPRLTNKDFANLALDVMDPKTPSTPEASMKHLMDWYEDGRLHPQDLIKGMEILGMSADEIQRVGQTRAHENELLAQIQEGLKVPDEWREGAPGSEDFTTAEKGLSQFEDFPIEDHGEYRGLGYPVAKVPEARPEATPAEVDLAKQIVDQTMKPSSVAAANTSIEQERAASGKMFEGKPEPLEVQNPELASDVNKFMDRGVVPERESIQDPAIRNQENIPARESLSIEAGKEQYSLDSGSDEEGSVPKWTPEIRKEYLEAQVNRYPDRKEDIIRQITPFDKLLDDGLIDKYTHKAISHVVADLAIEHGVPVDIEYADSIRRFDPDNPADREILLRTFTEEQINEVTSRGGGFEANGVTGSRFDSGEGQGRQGIILTRDANPGVVYHEFVHAYDRSKGIETSEARADEGAQAILDGKWDEFIAKDVKSGEGDIDNPESTYSFNTDQYFSISSTTGNALKSGDEFISAVSSYLDKNISPIKGFVNSKFSDAPPPPSDPAGSQSWLKDQATYGMAQARKMIPKNYPELGFLERLLGSAEWYNNADMGKLFNLFAHEKVDLSNKIFQDNEAIDLSKSIGEGNSIIGKAETLKNKGLSRMQILKGDSSREYKKLQEILTYGDAIYKRDRSKTQEEQIAAFKEDVVGKMKKEGFNDTQIDEIMDSWSGFRKSYDSYLNLLMAPMKQMRDKIKSAAEAEGARPDLKKFNTDLTYLINKMNSWGGFYAPRERENLKYVLQANKGDEYLREPIASAYSLEKRKTELERQGYEVKTSEANKVPEVLFSDLKKIHMASLLKKSISNLQAENPDDMVHLAKLHEEVLEQAAMMIQARGYLKSKMARLEDVHVKGYEDDPIRRYLMYARNTSNGLAKAEISKKAYDVLGGIDPKVNGRVYEVANRYIDEQLRNSDQADQVIGTMKSIASLKYLGLNFRSLLVNTTAVGTTAPAAIHEYALSGKVGLPQVLTAIGKAGYDFGKYQAGIKGNLSAEDQGFLDRVMRDQYATPQYTQDVMGNLKSRGGALWGVTMDVAMKAFGLSEQWNRGTTMLAAFREARKLGIDPEQATMLARTATEKAHGVYGKSTLPEWAQGTNVTARMGQMMYSYAKFGHNYVQMLYDLGARKGNLEAFAYALISPAILAGAGALPFMDNIKSAFGWVLKAMGIKRDPEQFVMDKIRGSMGPQAEKAARYGVIGLLGGDISSSLNVSGGVPKSAMELLGPFGGVVDDVMRAGKFMKAGETSKAAESLLPTGIANPLKAVRGATEGVTTTSGRRLWDEEGKPFKYSTGEALTKAAGFRPTDEAILQSRKQESQQTYDMFKNDHDSILESLRAYMAKPEKSPEDLEKIKNRIKTYNQDVISNGLQGQVSLITGQSIKTQLKNMMKPTKKEMMRLRESRQ